MPLAQRFSRLLGPALLVCCLAPLTGCGASAGKVTGKVTHKGAPLKGGNITFVGPPGTVAASGQIQEDGTYSLDRAPAGAVQIAVETSSLKPRPGQRPGPTYAPPKGANVPPGYSPPAPVDNSRRYVSIPEKYEKVETSGLTATIKGGSNTHDIDLP